MSATLLQHLINLTEASSVALCAILLLRPVLRRHDGAALVYASWWLLPLTLLASVLPHPAMHTPVFSLPVVTLVAAGSTAASSDQGLTLASLWLLVWGTGAALAAVWMVWQQLRFVRSLGRLQPGLLGRVYFAVDNTQMGPLLLGLVRPRIVLPADFASRYTPQEQALILAHEQAHLRRHDVLANALASALQMVFWFNPLLHFAANRFRLDQELACDVVVVRQYPQARQVYADAILKTQLVSNGVPLACHWQSHHPLKERILQLSQSPPSRARRRSAMAVLATIAVAACYGAWATEQAPANGASSANAADAQRYEVSVDFKMEAPGTTQAIKTVVALRAGELARLSLDPARPLECTIGFEIDSLPHDQVMVKMPFNCHNHQREPRVLTQLGNKATVKVAKDSPDGTAYAVEVTVHRWSGSKP